MRLLSKLLIAALLIPFVSTAQEETPSYFLAEIIYIKVNVGQEKAFEEAVKKHNDKYHAEDPHKAYLWYIATGRDAGWYVWQMRGMTFTQLDSRPTSDDHREDWDKTISPYVHKYGRSEIWRNNMKLSHVGETGGGNTVIWLLDVARGDYYRFKSFMEKVIDVYKEQNESIYTWNNTFPQDDGRDVAVTWPFPNWATFDKDDWKMKDKYDEKFGEGAWDDALEEWDDVIQSVSQEVWTLIEEKED